MKVSKGVKSPGEGPRGTHRGGGGGGGGGCSSSSFGGLPFPGSLPSGGGTPGNFVGSCTPNSPKGSLQLTGLFQQYSYRFIESK
jgi:hypothetical protein